MQEKKQHINKMVHKKILIQDKKAVMEDQKKKKPI